VLEAELLPRVRGTYRIAHEPDKIQSICEAPGLIEDRRTPQLLLRTLYGTHQIIEQQR
jgi:hypothetical protein